MRLSIIIGSNKIYGAYNETICYESEYKQETEEKVLTTCKSVLFNYGLTSGSCFLSLKRYGKKITSTEVFKILESN